ncbi:MAG: S8 family serine peptidase [Saprospiraceae bacterium]|nr:S8 family serine peptidase [Saprospiraceae bacterium]
MRPGLLLLLSILCSLLIHQTFAQEEFPHIEGDLLIRIKHNHSISWVIKDLAKHKGLNTQLQARELLSEHMQIWRFTFNKDILSHNSMLELALKHPSVHNAQLNYIMEKRVVPNDPSYNQQWQYEQTSDNDLDAEAAWDITTGGVTALGDTIVVCVIDDGIEVSHADWGDNIWYNHGEINGNGIDDDNNGYIDDYRGWNADNNNNDIVASGPFSSHGTPVSGIIAAKGNNNIGVSGVNWNVKLMFVVGGGTSANSIAAYNYPFECRKLYNQTNGVNGAFVVATNASWGQNNQQCATYAPLVNEFYDTLGVYGILNCAATANANIDVDVNGDYPTSCDSDYLIAVTNINQSGTKVGAAGYGSTHIDLGAFGEGTYTLTTSSGYGGFGGTSGATPHVTGNIGLMYSAPCQRFAQLARTHPAQTALMVKQILLNSSVSNSSLLGITVSEGVLNMKNSIDSIMSSGCSLSGCHEPYNTLVYSITGTSVYVNWDRVDSTSLYFTKFREIGSTNWITGSTSDTFTILNNLTACTSYEIQIASDCDSSAYSTNYIFKTEDCCFAPTTINIDTLNQTSASFSWATDSLVNSYTIDYKLKSSSVWSSVTATSANVTIAGLDSCEIYELRIISSCQINVNNQYSSTIEFETVGCGNCSSTNYCNSSGQNSSDDWIENVTFGTINNTTGDDGGYISFVNGGPSTDIAQGGSYPISIEIGFNTGPWATNWLIQAWIDYNQDEIFDNTTELVYDAGPITTTTTIHTGTINVPNNASLNKTRLRVAMKWGTTSLTPCDNPFYGETEDYCVNIIAPTASNAIKEFQNTILNVYPNPFSNHLIVSLESHQIQNATIKFSTITGHEFFNINKLLSEGENLLRIPCSSIPKGMYLVSIQLESGIILTKKVIKG